MKTITINRDGIVIDFPLTLVHAVVDTGGDGLEDAEMLAGWVFDAVNTFTRDDLAADTINFQMIDGEALSGEVNGCEWKINA